MKNSNIKTTATHSAYNAALYDHDMLPVVAFGSAGTGKTYGAVKAAFQQFRDKKFEQIIVTRPNVSFAEQSGFLPGTEREKMEPWVRPILQNLEKFTTSTYIETMEKYKHLSFFPLESIQGMTFDNSFIIVDECQNMSFEQLKVFLTRTGNYSKVVLCGDVAQISPKFHNSGLAELLDMIDYFDMRVHTLEFTRDDIVRSEDCKIWITAFEEWDSMKYEAEQGGKNAK